MFFEPLDIPDELVEAQEQGKLVVFAVAGVSMGAPSNLPSFKGWLPRLTNMTPGWIAFRANCSGRKSMCRGCAAPELAIWRQSQLNCIAEPSAGPALHQAQAANARVRARVDVPVCSDGSSANHTIS